MRKRSLRMINSEELVGRSEHRRLARREPQLGKKKLRSGSNDEGEKGLRKKKMSVSRPPLPLPKRKGTGFRKDCGIKKGEVEKNPRSGK